MAHPRTASYEAPSIALSDSEVQRVLTAVGLVLDLDSAAVRTLPPRLRRAVQDADRIYRSVVGQPADERERSLLAAMGYGPGSESALFRRLLKGKAPFPVAPPTNCSYPWYGLLDAPGPRHVSLDGASTLGSFMRAHEDHQGAADVETLTINQCFWRLETCNDAARTCIEAWEAEGAASERGLTAARDAEWIVSHPGAPRHRVYWGTAGVIQRGCVADVAPSLSIGEFKVIRFLEEEPGSDASDAAEVIDADRTPIAAAFARRAHEPAAGSLQDVEYVRWGWMLEPLPNAQT